MLSWISPCCVLGFASSKRSLDKHEPKNLAAKNDRSCPTATGFPFVLTANEESKLRAQKLQAAKARSFLRKPLHAYPGGPARAVAPLPARSVQSEGLPPAVEAESPGGGGEPDPELWSLHEEELAVKQRGGDVTDIHRRMAELKRRRREQGNPVREGAVVNGRYQLQERVGYGGFGTVWRAIDHRHFSLAGPARST